MVYKTIKKHTIIAFLITCCLYSCNKKELIGKWSLHIIESKDSLNVWNEANWMRNSTGRLQYYDNDTVSVHFNPENYGDSGVEPYWYIARYKINYDSSFVEHKRVKHSNPEEVGKTVKRYFEINKDTLTMHAKEFGFRLKWVKIDE